MYVGSETPANSPRSVSAHSKRSSDTTAAAATSAAATCVTDTIELSSADTDTDMHTGSIMSNSDQVSRDDVEGMHTRTSPETSDVEAETTCCCVCTAHQADAVLLG